MNNASAAFCAHPELPLKFSFLLMLHHPLVKQFEMFIQTKFTLYYVSSYVSQFRQMVQNWENDYGSVTKNVIDVNKNLLKNYCIYFQDFSEAMMKFIN